TDGIRAPLVTGVQTCAIPISINTTGGLGDYPKFGIWPDGIYMSANMFDYAASGSFQNVRLYAFNKAQMYSGGPTIQVISFDAPRSEERRARKVAGQENARITG